MGHVDPSQPPPLPPPRGGAHRRRRGGRGRGGTAAPARPWGCRRGGPGAASPLSPCGPSSAPPAPPPAEQRQRKEQPGDESARPTRLSPTVPEKRIISTLPALGAQKATLPHPTPESHAGRVGPRRWPVIGDHLATLLCVVVRVGGPMTQVAPPT